MNLQIPITQMKAEGNWPLSWTSAAGLVQHVANLGDNITGCELGVSYGFNLVYFLENLPNLSKVYAIDPYAPYDDGPSGYVPQDVMDKVKSLFLINTEEYKDKLEFLNLRSEEAHSHIPDGSLDYIFIDGDHSYDAVIKDLNNYFSKVRSGGIFAGHDHSWQGVTKALAEFRLANKIKAPLQFCHNDVWYWIKE